MRSSKREENKDTSCMHSESDLSLSYTVWLYYALFISKNTFHNSGHSGLRELRRQGCRSISTRFASTPATPSPTSNARCSVRSSRLETAAFQIVHALSHHFLSLSVNLTSLRIPSNAARRSASPSSPFTSPSGSTQTLSIFDHLFCNQGNTVPSQLSRSLTCSAPFSLHIQHHFIICTWMVDAFASLKRNVIEISFHKQHLLSLGSPYQTGRRETLVHRSWKLRPNPYGWRIKLLQNIPSKTITKTEESNGKSSQYAARI